ncbi:MAG: hypothetical protein SF182_06505, partial [Deltaproteobacteria bacterium]|nr:hypothetical protein [Deltaproteobacteria bacterium]
MDVPPERDRPPGPPRLGLPWQLVGVAAPLILAALLALAWFGVQLAEQSAARGAAAHLVAVRTAAEVGAAAELARLEEAARRI